MRVFRSMVRRSAHFCEKRAFPARSFKMNAGRTFEACRTCMDCVPKMCSLSHKWIRWNTLKANSYHKPCLFKRSQPSLHELWFEKKKESFCWHAVKRGYSGLLWTSIVSFQNSLRRPSGDISRQMGYFGLLFWRLRGAIYMYVHIHTYMYICMNTWMHMRVCLCI